MASLLAFGTASCVDSDNMVLVRLPILAACGDAEIDYDSGKAATTINVDVEDFLKNGQVNGYDDTAKVFLYGPDKNFRISIAGKNSMASTTSYTSIGAGVEHRINQNNVALKKLIIEVVQDGETGFAEVSEKPISGTASQGANFALKGVVLLTEGEMRDLAAAVKNSGYPSATLIFKVQVQGTFAAGNGDIRSSTVEIPVNICVSGSCAGTTPICEVQKK